MNEQAIERHPCGHAVSSWGEEIETTCGQCLLADIRRPFAVLDMQPSGDDGKASETVTVMWGPPPS